MARRIGALMRLHWGLWALLGITIFGCGLRFYRIERPALWHDEAMTFARTSTDYQDLLDRLQNDGFGPLHYELYWWVSHGLPLWDGEHPLVSEEKDAPWPHHATMLARWGLVVLGALLLLVAGGVAARHFDRHWVFLIAAFAAFISGFVLLGYLCFGKTPWREKALLLEAAILLAAMIGLLGIYWVTWLLANRRLALVAMALAACGALIAIFWFYSGHVCWDEKSHGAVRMTPFIMRSVPAIAGTLMIPAMYFLARQIASRPVAVLTAALTACSGFMLNYSRDAKMYPAMWLFLALHVGCLLWWLNSRKRAGWLGWIACGLAACGLHPAAPLVLLVQPIALVTAKRHHWAQVIMLLIGMCVIAAGPGLYYSGYNKWVENTGGLVPETTPQDDGGRWSMSGVNWVPFWQEGRSPGELVLHTATAFLTNWEWPKDPGKGSYYGPDVREKVRDKYVMPRWTVISLGLAFAAMCAIFILGAMPWPAEARLPADADRPWWRAALLLGAWIVVPVYSFFYIRASTDFASPGEALEWAAGLWKGQWAPVLGVMVALAALLWLVRPTWGVMGMVLGGIGITAMGAMWLTAPIAPAGEAVKFATEFREGAINWALKAFIVLLVPLCWHFSGRSTLERLKKLGQLAAITAVVILLCHGAYHYWTGVKEAFRAATLAQNPEANWELLWQAKMPNMWMPRYLGVVWPAVGIAAAALVMRLPTWPVRGLAIAVLLGVNLANGMARVVCDTEPPFDLMARDIVAGQDQSGTVRTVCGIMTGSPSPGEAGMYGAGGQYYLCMLRNLRPTYAEFVGAGTQGLLLSTETSPASVASLAKSNAVVDRLIVWQRFDYPRLGYPQSEPSDKVEDDLLKELGPEWSRVSLEKFEVWQHLSWRKFGVCWRREYVRGTPAQP